MRLRPAEPSDAAALAAISIEVWLGTYIRNGVSPAFADFALQEFTPARFAALIGREEESFLVSQNRDGPDGFIRLSRGRVAPVAGCSTCEITTLYVQPRHHGRGVGRALLDAGLGIARDTGHGSAWLTTNSENTPAIGFYLARGFEKVGVTHFRIGDAAYPNDIYRFRFA